MALLFTAAHDFRLVSGGFPADSRCIPDGTLDNHRLDVGRRDWTRTNDPHHVKVVL
jgi:hypothetical protein